jgi:hypothetical protein
MNIKDRSHNFSAAWIILAGVRFECVELISSNFIFTKSKIKLRSKCSEYALHSACPCLTLLDLVAVLCTTSLNVQKSSCSAHIVHLSGFVTSEQCLFLYSVLSDWFHNRVGMCLPRGSN